MNQAAYHLLRIGLGITFIWIADAIWKAPELWTGFLPIWFESVLPLSPIVFMQIMAVLDFVLGLFLILGLFTSIISLLVAFQLCLVIFVSGFTDTAARDFGLFTSSVALFLLARSRPSKQMMVVPMQE